LAVSAANPNIDDPHPRRLAVSAANPNRNAALLRGFPPVVDARVVTLILGSFPSAASLAAGQYYAHPRNQFWPIVGGVLGEPLAALLYEQRLARVLRHRVGIWDVYGACQREGSLDAAIRDSRANDFDRLRALAPRLRRVLFNGKAAGRFAAGFEAAGFDVAVLPSTSPAHAGMTFEAKRRAWAQALRPDRPVRAGAGAA
jgi:hypoxanthine-DNA glycosylase